jgi:hypothetical protein
VNSWAATGKEWTKVGIFFMKDKVPSINLLCFGLIVSLVGCSRPAVGFEGLTFSPDGAYIFTVYPHSNSAFIYRIPISTGKAVRLTNVPEGFEGVPSFSQDGKRIVYSFGPATKGAHSQIVIANADGSDRHFWATSQNNDFRPLFSGTVPAFSDFLLHDIGTGDGVAQGAASPYEFRTAPLWGLRLRKLLLHDGRALSPTEAIEQHHNEADSARVRFEHLKGAEKQALLDYLSAL